jgi:pyruvate/2-oxoglutarate dehydrogenase complex dihydrolipoamide dehydrogenase (E3) component
VIGPEVSEMVSEFAIAMEFRATSAQIERPDCIRQVFGI